MKNKKEPTVESIQEELNNYDGKIGERKVPEALTKLKAHLISKGIISTPIKTPETPEQIALEKREETLAQIPF